MSGLKYIGGGAWIPGIPARNLSAEEATQYAAMIEASAAAGHILYVAERKQDGTGTAKIAATADDAPIEKGRL